MTTPVYTTFPDRSPSDILRIQARPSEHEAIIRRQGQSARMVQLIKCPCNKNGRVDIHCAVCDGRGYIFKYQTKVIVIDENSPHFGIFETFPFGTPLVRGIAIQKVIHDSQGGTEQYVVSSNTTTKIVFTGSAPPKRYERIRCTYEYSLEQSITDENSKHAVAGYTLHTTGSKIELVNTSNPFDIHGDLIEVSRVYNTTTDTSYSVLSFSKQTIILDDESGVKAQIEVSDILQVDYKFVKPAVIGTGRVTVNNAIEKWAEEVKEGDIQALIPGGYFISKGDIITLLTPRLRETVVIARGTALTDELPQFDVNEILYDIVDEDGTKYVNDGTKYNLSEYNDLVWISGQAPTTGKKYTVTFLYHPTYKIYRQEIDVMTNEDRRFPHQVSLRFMNKFSKKDLAKF